MKKYAVIICIIAAFGFANKAAAQAQVAIGLKGGLNFAKLDVSNSTTSLDSRTGFHGGPFVLFKLSKIGIQPEILFSKQGTSFKGSTQDLNANFDYINIPIMLKLYTVAGINLQLGPQFGFLTKAEIENEVNGVVSTGDVKDLYKKSDLALAFGLGWDLPFGLTIDARYNLGLSKIEDNSSIGETKNKVIQVSVGYKLFKLGK
jgi:hypothetical protein